MKTLIIDTPTKNIIVAILHLIDHHSSHVVTDDNKYRISYNPTRTLRMTEGIPLFLNRENCPFNMGISTKISITEKTINITAFENDDFKIDKENWTLLNGQFKTIKRNNEENPTGYNSMELSKLLQKGFKLTTKLIRSTNES